MINKSQSVIVITVITIAACLCGCKSRCNTQRKDWLIDGKEFIAQVTLSKDGKNLVLSNGLVERQFRITPNVATIGVKNLFTSQNFLRSIRPEAVIEIDGIKFNIGGLTGQPIQNYLLPEWLEKMEADPAAFNLFDYSVSEIKERFPLKKRMEWMSRDMPWPLPGKELVFRYRLDDNAVKLLAMRNTGGEKQEMEKLSEEKQFGYLKNIVAEVHYELYNGMPVFSKWIRVVNETKSEILINTFISEILAVTEPESVVDSKKKWTLPNITLETDYNFGGMSDESITQSSVSWGVDSLYDTQVNYERSTPCLLEACPKYGPSQVVQSGRSFESFRTWELIHDSWDRERKGLEHRRMMSALAPWSTENPVLMHVSSSKEESVRLAVDQCAQVGFEMIIMTFGSGLDIENESPENINQMKSLAGYAHSKGIALGGYSLLASRSVDAENDVVMPEGMTPRFGHSPCLESEWGINYFKKLYNFYDKTGLDVLEHDGSYPGDICTSIKHPGHKGIDDSQWNQYREITDFYKWCRGRGIYLNVPDYYFLSGSNKTGMGYRETNWSLPREQQEIIERQNIYDGTWEKTPSMGWMFVPLTQYHGGGAAATIEPLNEHLEHYNQRLANLFGAGVQACYRGPRLFDTDSTKDVVKKWVDFYKNHRQVLDADIIHLRRPDGADWDGFLHVNPAGEEKGLLMLYNPLKEEITRDLEVPVYYTGLTDVASVKDLNGKTKRYRIDRDYKIKLKVTIPAKGSAWYVIR